MKSFHELWAEYDNVKHDPDKKKVYALLARAWKKSAEDAQLEKDSLLKAIDISTDKSAKSVFKKKLRRVEQTLHTSEQNFLSTASYAYSTEEEHKSMGSDFYRLQKEYASRHKD